ncbi:homoserine kinase [Epidermidibacterium keratini]|uniref:Homoserine kinase n=1 Tax=Epidermidibacterium keratini TaxID=1891644 RepID=A0A7L4YRJ2_9ACTN|nr:homoserine kinase [Epidermidibacterium keratini]QHC01692.1 homoserine kinase [Epidermidibacterium keratini]
MTVEQGRMPITVHAEIPATTANLGPGFDCMGLALGIYDSVSLSDRPDGDTDAVEITGAGADTLPRDRTHLVLGTLRDFFEAQGFEIGPLVLRSHNRIPQGQGLGSSASAITAALVLGKEFARRHGHDVSDVDLFQIGSDIDGHPDNVGPCIFGGMTVSWDEGGCWERAHLVPHPSIRATLAIPHAVLSTKVARGLIPDVVPHHDAVRNSARAALAIHAFTTEPALLLPATRDFLHQDYRASAYPQSYRLVQRLRERGIAAAISGAGPAVIVFTTDDPSEAITDAAADDREFFDITAAAIDTTGAQIVAKETSDTPNGNNRAPLER